MINCTFVNNTSIPQGSEAWKQWRNDGIGSSESSVLMGMNKYETVQDLFFKKTGQLLEEKQENEAMRHGSSNEDYVRMFLNKITGSSFEPICAVNNEYPFIRSSLDGFYDEIGLEIKCPFNKYSFYNHCKKVPEYYYCQVQHHYLTIGHKEEYFVSWFEGKKTGYLVKPNPRFIEELKKRIMYFWKCVEDNKEPSYDRFRRY